MSGLLTKILRLPVQFPLVRGMLSYALIWPTCSIVQEYIQHGTSLTKADWARAARFSIFGTFFMAPVFYSWMKYSSRFFKRRDLMTAISRAAVEQVSYSPLAMAYFFFGMSVLEGKSYNVCVNEVREKFWPTYKMGVVFWPIAQTLNFYLVSEKNRIVFVSAASFVWTVYLAHMKAKEQKPENSYSGLETKPVIIEHTTNIDQTAEDNHPKQTTSVFGKLGPVVGENFVPTSLVPNIPVAEVVEELNKNTDQISPAVALDNAGDEKHPEVISDERDGDEDNVLTENASDEESNEEFEEETDITDKTIVCLNVSDDREMDCPCRCATETSN